MIRTLDPEHNWFWQEGYRDGFDGERAVVPDETRHSFQRSDYFRGHADGIDDRAAHDEDEAGRQQACSGCGGSNTRQLTPMEHECFDCQETW